MDVQVAPHTLCKQANGYSKMNCGKTSDDEKCFSDGRPGVYAASLFGERLHEARLRCLPALFGVMTDVDALHQE